MRDGANMTNGLASMGKERPICLMRRRDSEKWTSGHKGKAESGTKVTHIRPTVTLLTTHPPETATLLSMKVKSPCQCRTHVITVEADALSSHSVSRSVALHTNSMPLPRGVQKGIGGQMDSGHLRELALSYMNFATAAQGEGLLSPRIRNSTQTTVDPQTQAREMAITGVRQAHSPRKRKYRVTVTSVELEYCGRSALSAL